MKEMVLEELKTIAYSIPNADQLEGYLYKLADFIFNRLIISNDKESFRISEIEFYIWPDKHKDPFSHQAEDQLEFGCWYFHESGLDITFGDNKTYASFLIRGIRQEGNPGKDKFISGPLKVMKTLCNSSQKISSNGINLKVSYSEDIEKTKWIKHKRIGLTPNMKENSKKYSEKNYRYISWLVPNHKFPNRIQSLKFAFENNQDFNAKEAFSYNPGFLKMKN